MDSQLKLWYTAYHKKIMETLFMDIAYQFNINYSQKYQNVLLGELTSQGGPASMKLTASKVLDLFVIHKIIKIHVK
jgi:hypothetical protein